MLDLRDFVDSFGYPHLLHLRFISYHGTIFPGSLNSGLIVDNGMEVDMLRNIVIAALLVFTACNVAKAENFNRSVFQIAAQKIAKVKSSGIELSLRLRNRVCPLQKTVTQKSDCTTRFNQIVSRLRVEELIVNGVANTAKLSENQLPYEQWNAMMNVIQPDFNARDNETGRLYNETVALYPDRQAAE